MTSSKEVTPPESPVGASASNEDLQSLLGVLQNWNVPKDVQLELDDLESFDWVDKLRVECRDLQKRVEVRKHFYVFEKLTLALDILCNNHTSDHSLIMQKMTSIGINCLSAFANIVVEDDPETLSACFNCFKAGLFRQVCRRVELTLSKGNDKGDGEVEKLEAKLQMVGAIALTNFTLQFVQNKQFTEAHESELVSYLSAVAGDDVGSPVILVLQLAVHGKTTAIRKSALSLLGKLADFRVIKGIICSEPMMEVLLTDADEILKGIANNRAESAGDMAEVVISTLASIYHMSSSQDVLVISVHPIFSTLMEIVAKKIHVPREARVASIRFFMNFLRGKFIMPGEEESEDDVEDLTCKTAIVNKAGLIAIAIETLSQLIAALYEKQIFVLPVDSHFGQIDDFEFIYPLLELVNSCVPPLESSTATLDYLVEKGMQQLLFDIILFSSAVIEILWRDTLARKKTSPKADIDRELVLSFAKIRKVSFFLFSMMATSTSRCSSLINTRYISKLSDLENSAHEEAADTISLDHLVTLTVFMVKTMCHFDLEGTEVAISLLKNLFIAETTRSQCIDLILKHDDKVYGNDLSPKRLALVGNVFCQILRHPSHKVSIMASGINRLISQLVDDNVILRFYTADSFQRMIALDVTMINPTARVETSRFISYLIRTVSKSELDVPMMNAMKGVLFSLEALEWVSFLLQSKFAILTEEGLAAVAACPKELQVEVMNNLNLYFDEDSEDYALINMVVNKEADDLAEMLSSIEKIDGIDITEEDVDLSKIDESEMRAKMVERIIEQQQNKSQQSSKENNVDVAATESNEEGEAAQNDETKLKEVLLRSRIEQLSKGLFSFEDVDNEMQKNIVALSSNIFQSIGNLRN